MSINLSPLGHTWILDLDGSLVKHNGYKTDGHDSWLPGAKEFLSNIPNKDMIVFITSRTTDNKEVTERFLAEHGVRYNHIICDAPFGERILINDCKPSGLKTAIARNLARDGTVDLRIAIDKSL